MRGFLPAEIICIIPMLFEYVFFSEMDVKTITLISREDYIAEHPLVPLANLARTLSSCSPNRPISDNCN